MTITNEDEERDPDVVRVDDRRVRQGGLMRCCLSTISDSTEPSRVGDVLDCKYEKPGNANMRVAADGVWEWNHA